MDIHIDQIYIEGIDKTGKDSLMNILACLSNNKYEINVRGHISNQIYAKLYDRPYNYLRELSQNVVYVYLYADIEDLLIRHKLTKEPYIDIDKHLQAFDNYFKTHKLNHLLVYNTSHITLYDIAKDVIKYIDKLNGLPISEDK